MRILDKNKIPYQVIQYNINDDKIDGLSVANKIGKQPHQVYKTLLTQGISKLFYVFVIPVAEELNLKKAAQVSEEKKIEMIPAKNLLNTTGYIKGGCSPVGMKKLFKTFINDSALELDKIIVSGGKIGMQIELSVVDLKTVTDAEICDIIK